MATATSRSKPRAQRSWTLTDAKAQCSDVVQRALDGEPQRITRHGTEAVVVVSADIYDRAATPADSIVAFFARSPHRDITLDVERSRDTGREITL